MGGGIPPHKVRSAEWRTLDAEWPAYRQAVGEHLRTLRLHANLTQEALAERAGVSRDGVQLTERGDITRMAALSGSPTP